MAFDHDKFKSLVHYVCWRCSEDPSRLGAVKLNKILWAADFAYYYEHGKPITGAGYIKRQFGPVPRAILSVLKELQSEGSLNIREVPFHGYKKKEFIADQPQATDLDDDERQIVDAAISLICDEHTAKSISQRSHDHVWRVADDGEEIPYFTTFSIPGEISEDELEWAKQELESMQA